MTKLSHPSQGCHTCTTYALERNEVLAPHMARLHMQTGEPIPAIAARFMAGVHARHLGGLPIMPGEVAA